MQDADNVAKEHGHAVISTAQEEQGDNSTRRALSGHSVALDRLQT